MKQLSNDELKQMYEHRRERVANYMKRNAIGATVFIDSEECREPAIRYLTGHICDAVLIVFDDAYTILIAWDEILASKYAFADEIIPYMNYGNVALDAVSDNLKSNAHFRNKKIELPPSTTYPNFLKFVDKIKDCDVHCIEEGVHKYVVDMRMIKDSYEIECTKEAARVGDLIIDKIEEYIKADKIKTETDVALLIEKECRANGCEKTGFDTLAAGPSRSWAIHCFPNYTSEKWPDDGLSILDFGVVYNGYTSDTTVTVVKGNISSEQEKIVSLVEKAYNECEKLYKPGVPIYKAAEKAAEVFAKENRKMPHGLGHATGLEIHEKPRVNLLVNKDVVFKPGMILTLEPGLYDEKLGGCRLENDILITEGGSETISNSRIMRI